MNSIEIKEKPDYISYDDIHQVLWEANTNNRLKGFKLMTSEMTADQLKQRIGDDGKCFVAQDGDRIVGTASGRIVEKNTWYHKGKLLDYMLVGVLTEYQGKHIYTMLENALCSFAKENHFSAVELDTASDNISAINIYKHQNFYLVDFIAKKNLDHYSVVMVKWLGPCPFSAAYIKLRYSIKKAAILLRYKKGKIKRFGL